MLRLEKNSRIIESSLGENPKRWTGNFGEVSQETTLTQTEL